MSDLAVFGTVTPGQKRGLVAGRKSLWNDWLIIFNVSRKKIATHCK